MDLKLAGKVALITGSSRGIGLATAKALAAEGCRLMLSARSAEQLAEAEGSCPRQWCKSGEVFALSGGFGRYCQVATVGNLKIGSSLSGAIVSSVM